MYQEIHTQLFYLLEQKEKDSTIGAHYPRIPLSFRPMPEISAAVKHMPPSRLGYSYIFLCSCEVSNYVIGISIQDVIL